jgi:hypothetical protein
MPMPDDNYCKREGISEYNLSLCRMQEETWSRGQSASKCPAVQSQEFRCGVGYGPHPGMPRKETARLHEPNVERQEGEILYSANMMYATVNGCAIKLRAAC